MKRLMLAAALGALCIGGAAVSAQSGDDACMQKGGVMTDNKCMLTIDAKVSVDYPLDLAANDLVAKTIDPVIAKSKDDFFSAIDGDFIPVPGPYELDITYDTVTHSDNVFTLVLSVYQFTGGAHGGTAVLPFTFDLKNNKLLTLDDVFTRVPDALKIIEPIAQSTIKVAVGDMNQQDMLDAGHRHRPEQLSVFCA